MSARWRWTIAVLVTIVAGVYFGWRVTALNPAHPVYSWIAIALELIGFARTLLFLKSSMDVPQRRAPSAPADLAVDVAVTTLYESVELVRETLTAVLAIRYPHTTWLLDDGARIEMRALADELGVHYIARTDRTHDKAGNLNNGIPHMRGAYVAVFDADHVPDPSFLDCTLGHFNDERVAFVQTPHEFRNTASFDHLRRGSPLTAQSYFNYVAQPARNPTKTAQYCSSAGIIRRAALDAIGGFATGTVNEDTHTSLRLNAIGLYGVFHTDVLALGLAPPNASAYYGQRQRFADGAMQLLIHEPLLWNGSLSAAQQQTFIFHVVANIEGWRYLVIYALPVAMLITGVVPLAANARTFLAVYIPYLAVTWIALDVFARGHMRFFQAAVYNLARVPSSIRATFSGHRLGRRFRVTPKEHTRAPATPTVHEAFPWLVVIVSLAAVAYSAARSLTGAPLLAPDALAVVSAWAAYHAVTAIRLIALTARCR